MMAQSMYVVYWLKTTHPVMIVVTTIMTSVLVCGRQERVAEIAKSWKSYACFSADYLNELPTILEHFFPRVLLLLLQYFPLYCSLYVCVYVCLCLCAAAEDIVHH